MAEASTRVKFLGTDGKVLPTDARQLLGVKEMETVMIRGTYTGIKLAMFLSPRTGFLFAVDYFTANPRNY